MIQESVGKVNLRIDGIENHFVEITKMLSQQTPYSQYPPKREPSPLLLLPLRSLFTGLFTLKSYPWILGDNDIDTGEEQEKEQRYRYRGNRAGSRLRTFGEKKEKSSTEPTPNVIFTPTTYTFDTPYNTPISLPPKPKRFRS